MRRSLTFILTLAVLLTTGAGCLTGSSGGTAPAPVTLEYWRMDDDPAALDEIIANYRKTRPHVTVNVTRISSTDYERVLLEALAEKRGPDLFNVRNVDLRVWLSKLAYLPKETSVPTQAMGADKKIAWTVKKTPSLSQLELRNTYVAGVVKDVLRRYADPTTKTSTNVIYGLPFSMDTLALIYNQELFKKASVQAPPTTWGDFQQLVTRLTAHDAEGKFLQSGTSLGGTTNERYSADMLACLMGQNGSNLTDSVGAAFDERTDRAATSENLPSIDALVFYSNFATEGSTSYSWNAEMPDSLDAFVQGRLAMFFGLPTDLKLIRERAPRLDVAVAALPQINEASRYNVALYPIEVVSAASKQVDVAWDFLQFAAKAGNVDPFLAATRRPTALRGLIDGQLSNAEIGPFSQQALTAVTWYLGENYETAKKAMHSLISFRPTVDNPNYIVPINTAVQAINSSYLRLR